MKLLNSPDQGLRALGKLMIAGEKQRPEIGLRLARRLQTQATRVPRTANLVTYLCDQIARHLAGETLTVHDVQLMGALVSDVAVRDTRQLHSNGTVATAVAAVAELVGQEPEATVVVIPVELARFGASEDRGWFLPAPASIALMPPPSRRTLIHELVHATQPASVEGPVARQQIVEGVTDALTSQAGEDFERAPSYSAESAAITALGEEAGCNWLEWLLRLNGSSRPEEIIAEALPGSPNVATTVHIFFEATRAAAEGTTTERVAAARRVVQARSSATQASVG